MSVSGTSAFALKTTKVISENEELYLNYGSDYFEDLPEGCPCETCNHNGNITDHAAGPTTNKRKWDGQNGEGSGASAKKDKKTRNRENRRKGRKEKTASG